MDSDSIHFLEYQRMLVDLHTMIAAGAGDSDDAMDLRDRMEVPEAQLSKSELFRLNSLSGDLSMIHDREIPDSEVIATVPTADLPRQLMRAYQASQWDKLLSLLRADVSPFLKNDQIAYMRSRAYAALGELAPAVAFMDDAARREPTNSNYRAMAMELLWADHRYDDAYARAKRYLADPRTPDRLVLIAAGVLSRLNKQDHPPGEIAATIHGALDRIERAVPGETSPVIRFSGLATLGLLAADTGDDARAAVVLDRALAEGGAISLFATRGLLLRELELIRGGRSRTPEERSLSSELADLVAPRIEEKYAMAA